MSRSSFELVEIYQKKLKTLEQMRKKQEKLFLKKHLIRRDIEEVYVAIFLNSVVSFEKVLEELFLGLLAGQFHSRHRKVNARIPIRNYSIAREVVLKGQNYLNWLPYANTKKTAEIFFVGGRPFTTLTSDEEKHLDKCLTIRNSLAHQSQFALNKFKKDVLPGLSLTPRDRNPRSFLRSEFSISPPTTYCQLFMGTMLNIVNKLG